MSVFTDPYQDSYPPGLTVQPVLSSIAPATGVVGVAQVLQLTGTSFYPQTRGYVNGQSYPTTYISSTQIRVNWTPTQVGTAQVSARNGLLSTVNRAFTVTAAAGQEAPTSANTKQEIVDWLLDHGVSFSESALMAMSKAELLDLVVDLLDEEEG